MDTESRVRVLRRLGVVLVVMTFALMVLGSWVKATGSGLSCPDWPQCYGEWLPPFPSSENGGTWEGEDVHYSQAQILYEWGHRALASILGVPFLAFVYLAVQGKELAGPLRALPATALVVLGAQVGIGGGTVIQGNPAWLTTLHLATATLFFLLIVMSTMFAFLRPLRAQAHGDEKPSTLVRDLIDISKPRIIFLLVIVAWAAMFVAGEGKPGLGPLLAVTVAGIASTAASGALNHVYEKDRDRKMARTADRPVASGRLPVSTAVTYGLIMAVLSFLVLWIPGMHVAAFLTLGAIAYYVVGYTMILKPTTPQNIVIGGFAGSFPALIGWAAVSGGTALPAWIIAAIVFAWTPPHFWALALMYKEDYAAADYPMMPTIAGDESTKRQMVFYAALTAVISLALVPLGAAGYLYAIAALWLGWKFFSKCRALLQTDDTKAFRSYFFFTIQYLGILLVALILDAVLVGAVPAAKPF